MLPALKVVGFAVFVIVNPLEVFNSIDEVFEVPVKLSVEPEKE